MKQSEQSDLTIACLVHDLNNVFQTILDYSDSLESEPRNAKVAAAIRRSVEHGQRLVRGFREVGGNAFGFEGIAASAIQMARDFLHATHRSGIAIATEIEPGLRLWGNPVSWERVLVNLILNSAEAMRQGGTVVVCGERTAEGARIRVLDEGPGIPAAISDSLFDPHISTKAEHSGLGLHIVRSIVQENGGTVEAKNRGGKGAEFVIQLPGAQGFAARANAMLMFDDQG